MDVSNGIQTGLRVSRSGRPISQSYRRNYSGVVRPENSNTETSTPDASISPQTNNSRQFSRIPLPATPQGSRAQKPGNQRISTPLASSPKQKSLSYSSIPMSDAKCSNVGPIPADRNTSSMRKYRRSDQHLPQSMARRCSHAIGYQNGGSKSCASYRDTSDIVPFQEDLQQAFETESSKTGALYTHFRPREDLASVQFNQFDGFETDDGSSGESESEGANSFEDSAELASTSTNLRQRNQTSGYQHVQQTTSVKRQIKSRNTSLPFQHNQHRSPTDFENNEGTARSDEMPQSSRLRHVVPQHEFFEDVRQNVDAATLLPEYIPLDPRTTMSAPETIESPSSLEKELLQLRIENKRLKQERQDIPQSQWPTLHRITCTGSGSSRLYADEPVLIDEKSAGHHHLDSRLRVPDEEIWLQRHPGAPFVVFKKYQCLEEQGNHEETTGVAAVVRRWNAEDAMADGPRPLTDPIKEEVRILSESLSEAVSGLSNLSRSLEIYWQNEIFTNDTFEAPYLFYFHSRDAIKSYASELDGQDRAAFVLLLEYFEQHSEDAWASIADSFAMGKVQSHMIPYLFAPGELVVVDDDGSETFVAQQAGLIRGSVQDSNRQQKRIRKEIVIWMYTASRLAFDGRFLQADTTLTIEVPRNAELLIGKLPAYPLRYATPTLKTNLLLRGRTFYGCSKNQYVTCLSDTDGTGRDLAEARYMVDVPAFHMMHPDSPKPEGREIVDLGQNDDHFLFQMPTTIQGFQLSNKRWRVLPAKDIKSVVWNKAAFNDLAISDNHKVLIEALVRNKINYDQGIDFVEGKGTGLIVLLHGPPGTGKTLTAESVAEIAEKPLYRVTCGDVGTDAVEIEKYLESVFHLGKRWECVVLLDEADVFLEQRTMDNLQRNALVSAFLRLIEFYDGILILTTNRVGTFDDAFKSRIQLALRYDRLTDDQRKRIWMNFIDRLISIKERMETSQIKAKVPVLARIPMNGREIRNTINTARQLARFRETTLSYEHIEKVVEAQREFEDYIKEVRGTDDEEFKRELGER